MASASIFFYFTLLVNFCAFLDVARGATNASSSFPAILVFGDSTVDTGNNNFLVSAMKGNHYPYGIDFPNHVATGRFSNGKLVVDFLASGLGIKDLVPAYADPTLSADDLRTGVCFASGGSGYDDVTNLGQVIPFSEQIQNFRNYLQRLSAAVGKDEATKIVNGSLVVISAGSNDFAFNFYGFAPVRRYLGVGGYQDFLQDRLQNFVKELYNLGCRSMAVAGLPPIGCPPIERLIRLSPTCIEDVNEDAQVYNQKLVKLLQQLENSLPGSRIAYADIYSPSMEMVNNPQKYGFTVKDRGCCGLGSDEAGLFCNAYSPLCPDRNEYMFWDAVHPGERFYSHMTKFLMDQLAPKFSTASPPPPHSPLTHPASHLTIFARQIGH